MNTLAIALPQKTLIFLTEVHFTCVIITYYTICDKNLLFKSHVNTFRLSCGIVVGSLTLSDVKKVCMLLTISKAWCLGRAVHRARLAKIDPVIAVTTSMNSKLIISGKVCMYDGLHMYVCV